MVLPFVQTGPPTLVLAPGYYTVREVAEAISRRGVPVAAALDCGEEVYAVRFTGAPQALLDALKATQRLWVLPTKGGWSVSRSVKDLDDDRSAVQRWCFRTIGETARIDARAAELAVDARRTAAGLPPAAGPSRIGSGLEARAKRLAEQVGGEYAFSQVAVPGYLAAGSTMPSVNRAVPLGLASERGLLGPGGDLRASGLPGLDDPKLGDADLAVLAASSTLLAKLGFDPVRDAATFRETTRASGSPTLAWQTDPLVLRYPRSAVLGAEDVLWPEGAVAYAKRRTASERLLAGVAAARVVALPPRPMRLSEALLRIGEGTGRNVVAYVSPLSDRTLPAQASRSLRSSLADANANRWDVAAESLALRERLVDKLRPAAPADSLLPTTVTEAGSALVAVDETDFLDLLASGPTVPSTGIENRAYADSPPNVAEVAGAVAALDIAHWKGSLFSEEYLRFCNPLSLCPFARLLESDPALLARVSALADGEVLRTDFDALASGSRAALVAGIMEAAPLCDAAKPFKEEPMAATLFLAREGSSGARLTARRAGSRVELSLEKGSFLWSSWVVAPPTSPAR